MLTLLDFENAILDLFENNRIPVQDAKIVLWTLLTAIYEDELIEEPQRGAVKRINDSIYKVESQSGNGDYEIHLTDLGWVCSCPDHKFRGVKCKHIFAVEISFALHKEVEVARIEPVDIQCCIYCKSPSVVKDGLRHNKYGAIQKFNCRGCGRYFTINLGFEKMHATPQMITSAVQLYFTGESFRNIQKFLRLEGVKMSHVFGTRILRRSRKSVTKD
jgi:transposase-like protein